MLLWKQTVTDRTQGDVNRVLELLEKGWQNFSDEEKNEWKDGLKGALNVSDLERIQNNIQLLSDVLEIGLNVSVVPELWTESFFQEILDNVEVIRKAYTVYTFTPQTPQMPLSTYEVWNDIEQILTDVHTILLNNFCYYCGNEIYAGDETGLLL